MKLLNIGLCLASALTLSSAFADEATSFTVGAVMESTTPSSASSSENKSQLKSTKKSDHAPSDSEITAKVKEKFIKEKLFGKDKISVMKIHVKTKNGVVTLKGTVAKKEEVDTAVNLAKSVEGVKDVTSNIKVKEAKK